MTGNNDNDNDKSQPNQLGDDLRPEELSVLRPQCEQDTLASGPDYQSSDHDMKTVTIRINCDYDSRHHCHLNLPPHNQW